MRPDSLDSLFCVTRRIRRRTVHTNAALSSPVKATRPRSSDARNRCRRISVWFLDLFRTRLDVEEPVAAGAFHHAYMAVENVQFHYPHFCRSAGANGHCYRSVH